MKTVPYLSLDDIEKRVNACLVAADMVPTVRRPVIDLAQLIEGPLNAELDEYKPLPPHIMGEVIFEPGRKDHVNINRDLTELADRDDIESPSTARARIRSTTAHEIGHIILHRGILMPSFEQEELPLFDSNEKPRATAYHCLKSDFGALARQKEPRPKMKSHGDFASKDIDHMEIQANKAMSALLLPRGVFCAVVMQPLELWQSQRGNCDDASHFRDWQGLIRDFSEQFEVSRRVIKIRIKMLNLVAQSQTPALF